MTGDDNTAFADGSDWTLELFDDEGNRLTPVSNGGWRMYVPSWDRLDTMIYERFDADGNIIERREVPSSW